MTPRFAAIFADAGALWRAERSLLLPLAGMFFLLPMLGIILLIAASAPPLDLPADQAAAALSAFYQRFGQTHIVPLALANAAIDYGIFAMLNLYLQGTGQTLGRVMVHALRALFPFLVLELLVGLGLSIGVSLFVVPGLFVFARTWLAAPALAANPQAGLIGALRQGWTCSRGLVGFLLLAVTAIVFVVGIGAMVIGSVIVGLVGGLFGGGLVAETLSFLLIATIGAGIWTALTLLRLAAYRAVLARLGM